jgi:hypothetical protein
MRTPAIGNHAVTREFDTEITLFLLSNIRAPACLARQFLSPFFLLLPRPWDNTILGFARRIGNLLPRVIDRVDDSVCRRGGLRANKFGQRRAQFCDIVTQCCDIDGEILGSHFHSFYARHYVFSGFEGYDHTRMHRGVMPSAFDGSAKFASLMHVLTLYSRKSCSTHFGCPCRL